MTLYPSSIDGYGSIPILRDGVDPIRSNDINRIRATAIAIEEELGINPSSTYATVRARLDALEDLLMALYVFDDPGDLLTWNGTDPAKLAAGPDGYVLVADSTETLGLRWAEIDLTPDGYGTVGGTGVAGRVALWQNGTDITSDADLTFDGSNLEITGEVRPDGGIRFLDDTLQTSAGANQTLSNLGTTNINTDLLPGIHDGYDVGSDAVRWQDGYYLALHTTDGVRFGDGTIQTTAAAGAGVANAQYLTLATHADLTAERVLTGTAGQIEIADGGANGNATLTLADTAVVAGNYPVATVTIDQKGRITSATAGSLAGYADRALSNLTTTTVNTSLLPATNDGYDIGSAASRWQDVFSTTANIASYVEFTETAAPSLPATGFGRLYEKTDGKIYFLNDNNVEYDLTEVGVGGGGGGADTALSNLTPTTINRSLLPATDDGYDIGSAGLRWRDIFLGPTSVRLISTAAETGTARDWKLGIVETAGATQGSFKILEGATQLLALTPGGQFAPNAGTAAAPPYAILGSLGTGIYSPAANQLGVSTSGVSRATVDDTRWTFSNPVRLSSSSFLDLTEAAAPTSPGAGLGRLYLDNSTSPSKLFFKDELGTAHDLTDTTISGSAGGDLAGTYPNPTFNSSVVSSFARTFLDDTTAAAVRATIGAGTGSGTVTSVSGSAPIASSGGTAPTLSLNALGVTTSHLADNAVTYAKMQVMNEERLLGVDVGGGVPTEITIGGGLDWTATGGIQITAFSGDVTKPIGGLTLTIANNAVTNAKILDGAVTEAKLTFAGGSTSKDASTTAHGLLPTLSGVSTQYLSGLGTWTVPAAAGAAGGDLTGTYPNPTIAAGAITTAKIADSTSPTTGVTLAKIQQINGGLVLGRYSTGLGSIQALSPSGGLEVETATGNLQIALLGVATARIANGAVTTSKLATGAATNAIIGTAAVTEVKMSLTAGSTALNFNTSTHGFVPISPGGTTRFLRADGAWAVP